MKYQTLKESDLQEVLKLIKKKGEVTRKDIWLHLGATNQMSTESALLRWEARGFIKWERKMGYGGRLQKYYSLAK